MGRINCSILCLLLNGAVKCYVPSLKAAILCASCRALQRTGFLSSLHNHLFLLWFYPSPLDQQQQRAEIKSLSSTLQWKPIKLEHKSQALPFMQIMSCKVDLAFPGSFRWDGCWRTCKEPAKPFPAQLPGGVCLAGSPLWPC